MIGEEGENVLAVQKGSRLFVPIFEATSNEGEGKVQDYIRERVLGLHECCLTETGKEGRVYGVLRNSYELESSPRVYVKHLGLFCTAEEFTPLGVMDSGRCLELGLPVEC